MKAKVNAAAFKKKVVLFSGEHGDSKAGKECDVSERLVRLRNKNRNCLSKSKHERSVCQESKYLENEVETLEVVFWRELNVTHRRVRIVKENRNVFSKIKWELERRKARKRPTLERNIRSSIKKERAVPGVPLSKAPAFVYVRIPDYQIPSHIFSLLSGRFHEIEDRILDQCPMFQHELNQTTYAQRFQMLLYLAEADASLDLRRYDMQRVKFERKGEYLALLVPGLAESRPSLLPGDKVETSSPFVEGKAFIGTVHRLMKTEVWLKFDPAFHDRYAGEDYSVSFHQGRGFWKKCHHGIVKVMQNLGSQWLFPTSIVAKPPQIVFEEVDEELTPPEQMETEIEPPTMESRPNACSSGETTPHVNGSVEKPMNGSRSSIKESSSSDEGYTQRGPRQKKPPPLTKMLAIIKEKNWIKQSESSDTESSRSVTKSETPVMTEKSPPSGPETPLMSSTRFTSESESDGDSGRRTNHRSPRDAMKKAMLMYSSGSASASAESSRNSSLLEKSAEAPSSPVRDGPPASGLNGSVGESNTPVNGHTSPGTSNINRSSSSVNGGTSAPAVAPNDSSKGTRLRWINKSLNCRQKDAVRNVLRGEARPMPYVIFGPPGTGKTMTLVETILQVYLLKSDSRILIATPSNSSANLIAERLLDSKMLKPGDMVRLVAFHLVESGTLPQRLIPYCALVDINAQAPNTPELFSNIPALSSKAIGRHRITISTCVTSGQLFSLGLPRDHFTHVFMDEAGQATEPEAMIPLAFLNRNVGQAILAGDPLQLGPVVPSKTAENFGLGVSFLDRIMKRFPYNKDVEGFPETAGYNPRLVTRLIYNYRSLPSVLTICSDMFYDSELVPTINDKESFEANVLLALTTEMQIPHFGVVFEGVRGDNLQEADDPSWFNFHEVVAVCKYVSQLIKLGIDPDDIGIITPYRKQVMKLRKALDDFAHIGTPPKIATVEEFQGQERLVMIVSTVRSCPQIIRADEKHHLGFVSSPRRLNVAISRARALLIVIGNPVLLCYDTYWRTLFKYCYLNNSYIGCNPPENVVAGLFR